MTTVYVLMKHPRSPFGNYYLEAGEIKGIYMNKSEAKTECDQKNSRKPYGLYAVHAKRVKERT